MSRVLRIGTRDSQLAVWQASWVQQRLKESGTASELVYIKSEGDLDTVTPLYELGVQGIFTKTLDAALLAKRIDLAVHSMKDVPTQLARGIRQAAVLPRASYQDVFVGKHGAGVLEDFDGTAIVGTSSIRRIAQWRHRYPNHRMENLRGNVNTRLRKVQEADWAGAIFAAAGLERIGLRPESAVDLWWMLPAPAQGAVMTVCRSEDDETHDACRPLDDEATALCTAIERDFLRTLMGGCSTPISALAVIDNGTVLLRGNIVSPDGKQKASIEKQVPHAEAAALGALAAAELLANGGKVIADGIRKNN